MMLIIILGLLLYDNGVMMIMMMIIIIWLLRNLPKARVSSIFFVVIGFDHVYIYMCFEIEGARFL